MRNLDSVSCSRVCVRVAFDFHSKLNGHYASSSSLHCACVSCRCRGRVFFFVFFVCAPNYTLFHPINFRRFSSALHSIVYKFNFNCFLACWLCGCACVVYYVCVLVCVSASLSNVFFSLLFWVFCCGCCCRLRKWY